MIDFALPDELSTLETELGRFAAGQLRPRMRDFEGSGAWDAAALRTFDAFAVSALDIPESWGGAGLGMLAKVVALEAVARGDAGGLLAADCVGPAAAAALACPDEAWAHRATSAALQRRGRCALVLGDQKHAAWIPGSEAPAWTWVSDGRQLRLLDSARCAVSPARAGALDASGGVALDLGGAEIVGEWTLDAATAALVRGRARLWPAAVLLGIAAASLDYAIRYARERIVMGRPVAHHQGNAFAISEAMSLVEAARQSVRAAACRIDGGVAWAGLWATLANLDSVDAALHATDLGVQLLGGHGYLEDHPVEKWFREARATAQLLGGRQAALEDAAEQSLEAPDPLLA